MTGVNNTPVHWARGGSNSDRIVACPGSVNEAAKWPREPSNRYAIDGTHTHTLLESCLNRQVHPQACVGSEMKDHEGVFVVDRDRAQRAAVAYNYVRDLGRDLPNVTLFVEQFVDAGAAYNIPEWGGSADVILHWDEGIEVIDYKDGGRPVNPETYQMITYAIGARHELQVPPGFTTTTTIIQPKVSSTPQSVIYSPIEFDVKAKILAGAMAKSLRPDAELAAGDHCKYCPGAKPGRCPEFNRRATVDMNEAFANVPTQTGNTPLQIPEINGTMSTEQLSQILDAAPIVKEWLKEAEAEGLRRVQAGTKIPGYKLVRSPARRKFSDDAMEGFQSMRLKKEVYLEEKLKTPKQVLESEAFKELSERRQKRIEDLVITPPGALKLVPESASGKAIEMTAEEAFANVPKPAAPPTLAPPPKPSFL